MYLWKCWRDTRALFVILLGIAALIMPIAALTSPVGLLRTHGVGAFHSTFVLLGALAAFGLGSYAAGEGFSPGTLQFLFSKPRSRAYFIWVGWAIGAIELSVVLVVNLLAAWFTLMHYAPVSHMALLNSLLASPVGGSAMFCLYAYCLSFALTVLLRGNLKGLGLAVALMIGCPSLAGEFHFRWSIAMPMPAFPIGKLPLLPSDIIWVTVALLIILGTQMLTERAEI